MQETMDCDICNDTGNIDDNEFCDCDRGAFYEALFEYKIIRELEDDLIRSEIEGMELEDDKRERLFYLARLPFFEGEDMYPEYENDWTLWDPDAP